MFVHFPPRHGGGLLCVVFPQDLLFPTWARLFPGLRRRARLPRRRRAVAAVTVAVAVLVVVTHLQILTLGLVVVVVVEGLCEIF